MKNIVGCFKFFSVGQGLFYGGNISYNNRNLFTFIYDCGTENKWKPYLDNAINDFKTFSQPVITSEITKLDLIIISHLHKDHFIGVYDLINKIGGPRKIILPLIEGDKLTKELILFDVFYDDSKDFNKNAFDYFARLYSKIENISPSFEVKEDYADENVNSYMFKQDDQSVPLFYNQEKIWKFHFVRGSVGRKSNTVISLIHNDIKILINRAGYTSIEEYIQQNVDGLDKIKDIYSNYGFTNDYSINNTSTIMTHYPISSFYDSPCLYQYKYNNERVVTILTGDSKINKNQAKHITDLLDKIEPCFLVTQLPHHGSNDNFKSIAKYLWTYVVNGLCVISFGIGNSHGHPGNNVLHSFAFNQLIRVNEYKDYCYYVKAICR